MCGGIRIDQLEPSTFADLGFDNGGQNNQIHGDTVARNVKCNNSSYVLVAWLPILKVTQ